MLMKTKKKTMLMKAKKTDKAPQSERVSEREICRLKPSTSFFLSSVGPASWWRDRDHGCGKLFLQQHNSCQTSASRKRQQTTACRISHYFFVVVVSQGSSSRPPCREGSVSILLPDSMQSLRLGQTKRKGRTASTKKRERRGRRRKRGTKRRRFCHTHHQRRKSSLSLHESCVLFFCLHQSVVARRKNIWDSQFPVVALLQEELLHC